MGAIGLNPIRLDRIGLDPIRINAIKLGVPGAASDRPYIDPEVLASLKAVCICYGKSNDDPDRAVVKNLVDPDNPFVISNAAYDKMSSYGGYEFAKFDNTLDWYNTEGNDSVEVVSRNGHSITLKRLTGPNFWYFQNSTFRGLISNVIPFKVNSNKNITVIWDVHGLSISEGKDKSVRVQELVLNPNEDNYTNLKTLNEEELAQIDISTNSLYYLLWFDLSTLAVDEEVTIEMLPQFEGAFVTDGIDDLITSTKTVQEMLGGSNEITVISMIHQIADRGSTYPNIYNNQIRYSTRLLRSTVTAANVVGKTGIYGYTATGVSITGTPTGKVVNDILGDKNDYPYLASAFTGIDAESHFSVEGYLSDSGNINETSKVAWYWTIIANKVLTTDQINQVIAYFNLDRTLNPDILCNVKKQGITNENHAEFGDKLIDFSGNGRDIQLNNIAWDGDSGIGKYNYPNWKVTATIANTYSTIVNYPTVNGTYSINVNGVSELMQSIGLHLEIKYTTSTGTIYNDIKQDGVYSYILPDGATDLTLRFGGIPGIVDEPCNITITQIPSHAGALCLDGVNDFGKVTGMPVYKDYTIIADYERISGIEQAWAEALISKSYIANQGAFVLMETNGMAKHSYSFGAYTTFNKDDSTRTLLYQSKYKCGDVDLNAGTGIDGDTLWLGTYRDNYSSFFNGAIYSLMSFPYSMSEFLIERQLKKHKLGTLYLDMVEFRPIVKSNNKWDIIEIWQGDKSLYRPTVNDNKTGIYLKKDSTIGIYVKPYVGQKVSEIVYNGVSYTDLKLNSNGFYYKIVPITKSPQKITMTIEQDENYVQWNPTVESNVEYASINYLLIIPGQGTVTPVSGQYYPILSTDTSLVIYVATKGVDEVANLTVNGQEPTSSSIHVDGRFKFEFPFNNSPQKINITIDEYIRYEDIVQPYPSMIDIYNSETYYKYTWGDKLKVGSKIIFKDYGYNLLPNLYNSRFGILQPNGTVGIEINHEYEVFKGLGFTATNSWILDDNEPKVILSPRLLRIPNSSYKILGHIPDISGHGNHGKINNSAYAEGSGVNEDGSFQFDGVDDFVTIPTTVGGKQVLMKVNWNTTNSIIYDQRSNGGFAIYCSDSTNVTNSEKVIAYRGRNSSGNTYIDGILNENIVASQLKDITHNIVEIISPLVQTGSIAPIIGKSYLNANYSQMALYDFMLFDEISTDDKIKELNEYVGIEAKVELPPYYWDAYGKTNLDADKATIQQRGVAIGDYDLTNYNHAYEGMNGYNGYPVVFGANKTWEQMPTGTFTWNIDDNKLHITKALIAGNGLLFSYVKLNGSLLNVKEIPSFKIKVSGLEGESKLWYRYLKTEDAISETMAVLENGTHELPKSYTPSDSLHDGVWVGFTVSPISEGVKEFDCDITIEVLPEYENGLVYDGVEDFSKNVNIPALTDYTYVIKRENLNNNVNSATMYKGHKAGGGAFIVDYISSNGSQQYSYGNPTLLPLNENTIIYGTKTSYNGSALTVGSNTDENGLGIGHWSSNYKSIVLYKLVLYPKTIPLLQINFLKNLMEKDEIIDLTNPIFIQ